MSSNIVRVETTPKLGEGMRDVRGDSVKRQLAADHGIEIESVRSIVGFLIASEITSEDVEARADDVFADPIIEESATDQLLLTNEELFSNSPDMIVTIELQIIQVKQRLMDLEQFSPTPERMQESQHISLMHSMEYQRG